MEYLLKNSDISIFDLRFSLGRSKLSLTLSLYSHCMYTANIQNAWVYGSLHGLCMNLLRVQDWAKLVSGDSCFYLAQNSTVLCLW